MVSLILGILLIAFCVFSVLPMFPLSWGTEVIAFLKGAAPVLSAFVGAADIKDKNEAKREEKEASTGDGASAK